MLPNDFHVMPSSECNKTLFADLPTAHMPVIHTHQLPITPLPADALLTSVQQAEQFLLPNIATMPLSAVPPSLPKTDLSALDDRSTGPIPEAQSLFSQDAERE